MKAATIDEIQTEFNSLISIHAAREGGDALACYIVKKDKISIHAAREGGDGNDLKRVFCHWAFQSTPPVKAATVTSATLKGITTISIHAAREGGDVTISPASATVVPFQSTPPVKAATMKIG